MFLKVKTPEKIHQKIHEALNALTGLEVSKSFSRLLLLRLLHVFQVRNP
jgi:hypothetical protein